MNTIPQYEAVSAAVGAKIAGVDPSHIRRWARDAKIRGYKVGNAWNVSRVDCERQRDAPAKTGRPRGS